jgi:hypothetical protein
MARATIPPGFGVAAKSLLPGSLTGSAIGILEIGFLARDQQKWVPVLRPIAR